MYRQHVYALRRSLITVNRTGRRRILHAFMLARSLPVAACPCLRGVSARDGRACLVMTAAGCSQAFCPLAGPQQHRCWSSCLPR